MLGDSVGTIGVLLQSCPLDADLLPLALCLYYGSAKTFRGRRILQETPSLRITPKGGYFVKYLDMQSFYHPWSILVPNGLTQVIKSLTGH